MGITDTGSQHVIWWICLVHIQDGDYKPDRYRSQKLLLQLLLTKGDPVSQLFSVASSWYDRGWHSGVELECVWGRLDRLLCLLRPKQSWQWVTFYDPWPTWPICQLTSDPRDPWPMTHDPWLLISHCHSVTLAYLGKSIDAILISYRTVPTLCTIKLIYIS